MYGAYGHHTGVNRLLVFISLPQGHTNVLFLFRVRDLTRSRGDCLGTSLTSACVCSCGKDPTASETVPRVASPAMTPIS